MKRIPRIAVIVIATLISGCTTTGRIGVLSKSGVGLENMSGAHQELGPAKGKACRRMLLGIIPVGNASVAKAMERALANSGADALVNVTVKTSLKNWIPTYNLTVTACTTVEGTAVLFTGGAP